MDNQGTGDIYSSLITRQNWEGKDEAVISVYRQGETEGSFVDNGNGELIFASEDGSPFSAGEEFEFPFTF